MAAIMLQSIPSFYTNFSEKVSSFLQKHMNSTLSVQRTASLITTRRRVFYPLVNIIFYYYYFEELLKSWILFASIFNTWIACIHYSSIDSVEKLLQRVDKCLITCNEQLTLIKETREWTECRALQKKGS